MTATAAFAQSKDSDARSVEFDAELDRLRDAIEDFRAGRISDVQFRAVRVPMGVYEQRQSGQFMLRARCPAGVTTPQGLARLAEVSAAFGNGVLHVTTRQDIQVHRVALEAIDPALRRLAAAGVSTRGGGGNTVRNITVCTHAGVCTDELFDVSPSATEVSRRLLADPRSFTLPRKYKLAFAGCGRDCEGALVNDLGFIARVRDGIPGFAVYVGGGMGARSRIGELLLAFIPSHEAGLVADAVKRVFDQHGNRKDKHRARLRFLVEQLGLARFRELYLAERAHDAPAAGDLARLEPTPSSVALPRPATLSDAGVQGSRTSWLTRCVAAQRQHGLNQVTLPLQLGDIDSRAATALADIAGRFGERALCTTQEQNLVLRSVRDEELAALHEELVPLGFGDGTPRVVQRLVACAGAATCKLGLCQSRGLAAEMTEALLGSGLDLDAAADVSIRISGCPNACGRHPLAAIAFAGAARRVGGQLVPHYLVQLGGRHGEERTRLAVGTMPVPARLAPRFVKELLTSYLATTAPRDFDAYLDAEGRGLAATLLQSFRLAATDPELALHSVDWGTTEPFSLAGRGPGECGAGVFDLIEVDLASAAEALAAGRYYAVVTLAARALLVTRGEQPANDAEALDLFCGHFLTAGFIDAKFGPLIAAAKASATAAPPRAHFAGDPADAAALLAAVRALYAGMDASLRFNAAATTAVSDATAALGAPAAPGATAVAKQPGAEPAPTVPVKDFRKVVCPLNYVKTKLVLASMRAGDRLVVLLDEKGARSVPASAAADGHAILSAVAEADGWRVLIQKGEPAGG